MLHQLKHFSVLSLWLISVWASKVDLDKTISWGPGLRPADIVLPARYFFIQLVDNNGKNLTASPSGSLDIHIGHGDKSKRCRVWPNILDRNDGSFIVRYKVYQICSEMVIDVRYDNQPLGGFPVEIYQQVLPDDCNCPENLVTWRDKLGCPLSYQQINDDLKPFPTVDMNFVREEILKKFNQRGGMSLCHYVVQNNEIHRTCHGQYVGFHIFMDAILLSLARKVKLADMEFFVNLGDWPLEEKRPNALPIFSWCGSEKHSDIVMPTYDITESTLECMGRVQLDMLSVQGNTGPVWAKKKPQAFWRGRDSRQERLDLVDIARANPKLFNVSLTNFFFFRDKEETYGPKTPHISFFKFFEYKYQLNIDGTVASYRFPYLLAGDSLVLKQDSPYYEHFYRDVKPNQHYVPVKRDLSDLVAKVKWAVKHDKDSRRIAKNGTAFARENLMPAHIFCYHAVLFEDWSKRVSSEIKVLPNMELVAQPEPSEKCNCSPRHEEL